jgi:hypothetical protein
MDPIVDPIAKAFERTNALQAYWAFYSSGVLGLLAFFGAKKRERTISVLLALTFIAFAAANLSAIVSVTKQRAALQKVLERGYPPVCDTADCAVARSVDPSTVQAVTILHVTGDLFVIAGIWLLTRKDRPATSADTTAA